MNGPASVLAAEAAAAVSRQIPWLRVEPAGGVAPQWWLADLVERQVRGEDPTADWRAAAARSMGEMNRTEVPPAVTSAFVLQWLLEVPGNAGACAAAAGPWLVQPLALGWDLAPAGHASRIVLGEVRADEREVAERLEAAEAAYRAVAEPLADTFTSDVKAGSQQRQGMVTDVWEMAQARALGSGEVVQRRSCCFLYALPGMHECAGCPRTPSAGSR